MADRYTTLPAGVRYSDWGEHMDERITVIESDDTPQKTGLLDANGVPLYRVKERIPVGFVGPSPQRTSEQGEK